MNNGMPMNGGMPQYGAPYGMPNVNIQPAQFQSFAPANTEMVSAESIGLVGCTIRGNCRTWQNYKIYF